MRTTNDISCIGSLSCGIVRNASEFGKMRILIYTGVFTQSGNGYERRKFTCWVLIFSRGSVQFGLVNVFLTNPNRDKSQLKAPTKNPDQKAKLNTRIDFLSQPFSDSVATPAYQSVFMIVSHPVYFTHSDVNGQSSASDQVIVVISSISVFVLQSDGALQPVVSAFPRQFAIPHVL